MGGIQLDFYALEPAGEGPNVVTVAEEVSLYKD